MDLAFLIATAAILLGAAATFKLWGPALLRRLRANQEVTRGLESFLQLALWLAVLATVVLLISSLALDVISANLGWFDDEGPPDSASGRHPVLDTFPLHEGASWTYSYTEETAQGVETGVVTETVVMVPSGVPDGTYLAKVSVSGRKFLNRCPESGAAGAGSAYWVVADRSRFYVACSRNEAESLATELVHGGGGGSDDVLGKVPEFVLPLQEGQVWQAFQGRPVDAEDSAYQWYVTSKRDLQVPAGTFMDCYCIQLSTLPDTLIRWVCPGTGIAAIGYTHHGALHDYRAGLIRYEVAAEE